MRELTFKGYLTYQLRELSGIPGNSVYAFSQIACNNARLKDVLSLYLILYVQENLKNKILKKYDYMRASCQKLCGLNEYNADEFLRDKSLSEYRTVYENYLYMRSKKQQEDKIKAMMYARIVEVKCQKKISNYCIYTQLRLNPGNVNSFLKNGDTSKVSLNTTREILSFVTDF